MSDITPNTNPTPAAADAKPEAAAEGFDISGLNIPSNPVVKTDKKADFVVVKDPEKKKITMEEALFERTFFRKVTKLVMLTLVLLILALLGYTFKQYLNYIQGKPVSGLVDYYMPTVDQYYMSLNDSLGLQNPNAYGVDSLTSPAGQTTLTSIVTDTSLDYIFKKHILDTTFDQLMKSTITQYVKLDEVKQDIGTYGYFPKEVQTFAASTFLDNSLQKSLLAVEAIRFSTALTFFSNLDTFLQQFGSFVSLSPAQTAALLEQYKARGEKDIQNYLTTCYFNPYVSAENCAMPQGNDFLNHYAFVDTTAKIDTKIFPALISYLDAKLESSDFPSLAIDIKSFDPTQNTISFDIDINTFKEDELQLLSKGILNPHIYLATKIINLLRESKFIVAEPINLSTLKVTKKKVRIGVQDFAVSNSTFDFILPLQKNAEREIYDFDQKQ